MQAIWFFASGMTGMAVSGAGGVPCWIIAKRWCHLGGITSSQTAKMPNRRRIDPGRCKRDSWQG
jgi:hypothetical protein